MNGLGVELRVLVYRKTMEEDQNQAR